MDAQNMHFYQPASGHGLPHDPLTAIIGPRPIGWISTVDGNGSANLAPYSFFNMFNYRPPIIGFASIGWKDSVANIAETREFVWNLASRPQAEAMNRSSQKVPHAVDEFSLTGLDKAPSRLVRAPRVASSHAALECKLSQIIQLTGADGQLCQTWLVLGEVVGVHIDTAMLDDGAFQTVKAQPILRGGELGDYFGIGSEHHFIMQRPT